MGSLNIDDVCEEPYHLSILFIRAMQVALVSVLCGDVFQRVSIKAFTIFACSSVHLLCFRA